MTLDFDFLYFWSVIDCRWKWVGINAFEADAAS